jgi:hypothetical protein
MYKNIVDFFWDALALIILYVCHERDYGDEARIEVGNISTLCGLIKKHLTV